MLPFLSNGGACIYKLLVSWRCFIYDRLSCQIGLTLATLAFVAQPISHSPLPTANPPLSRPINNLADTIISNLTPKDIACIHRLRLRPPYTNRIIPTLQSDWASIAMSILRSWPRARYIPFSRLMLHAAKSYYCAAEAHSPRLAGRRDENPHRSRYLPSRPLLNLQKSGLAVVCHQYARAKTCVNTYK